MKNKAKEYCKIFALFVLLYIALIAGGTSVYTHIKFGNILFNDILIGFHDALGLDWALKEIKLYLTIFFFISFFIVWFLSTKTVVILSVLLLLLPICEYDIFSHIRYKFVKTDFYEQNYVKPVIEKEKKNNLVIVYLESFEEHLATKEVSPFLANLKEKNISFDGFKQISSTHATIFAQFVSLCGIMIKQTSDDVTNFMPNVDCVSDLLKENGYNTAYIKAADIAFSQASFFAEQHGFDVIKGRFQLEKQASEISKDFLGNDFGGLRDKVLFEVAKDELSKLKEPFFATITTLDMHTSPSVYYDPDCEKKFGDIRDAASCTAKSLESFVKWLQKQPYWKNTTLIILGDHKIPIKYISKSQPLNIFINSKAQTDNLKRDFTSYDYAPTIMEAMGYNIKEFGVGRSLFNQNKTLYEQNGNQFVLLINSQNKLYEQMKDFNDTHTSYNPYKLGTILNNEILMNKYTDLGDRNNWCNKIVYSSMTVDNVPENGLYLKMRYLKNNEPFSIYANGTEIYKNKQNQKPGFAEHSVSIHLPKTLFKDDNKLQLKVSWPYNNMNVVFGLCIKEFVIDEKK